MRCVPGFLLTLCTTRQYDVADSQSSFGETENKASRADLDVVRMCTYREH